MLRKRGPALAGLFFALFVPGGLISQTTKLSPSGQRYFRAFVENFTPLVLRREKTGMDTNKPLLTGNYRWGDKNRDCAGLVRYIFWEAMQPHDTIFLAQYPGMSALVPHTNTGELIRISHDWSKSNFTALQLKPRTVFRGRVIQPSQLMTGDLLFFESDELQIRHVMLVVRSGPSTYLVYHTGDARNELRIRTLADLMTLPGSEWHPDPSNPVFRGVFRPRFLD